MKYMGSKARIAKHILPIILKGRKPEQWYVEPFVGGANMIDKVGGSKMGNDVNKYLIALLKHMQKSKEYPYLSKEEYAAIRANPENYEEWIVGYAGICCSYSGVWFGSYAGETITKQGVRDYQKEAQRNIIKQNVNGVAFTSGDYRDILLPSKSIIYCDIPYKGTSKYAQDFNHDQFYDWCTDIKAEGHTIFISEYYMPSYFKEVWSMPVKSSLSANGKSGGNKNSIERLYTL